MGFLDRLKKSLKKTREAITGSFVRVFRGKLDEDKLEEIEEALLEADVGVTTTDAMVDALRAAWKRGELTDAEEALPFLKNELAERLTAGGTELAEAPEGPTVILVVGVNGSGKTTSIAKLAGYLRGQGKSVVLGAGDTFRAAAVEQLTIWSKRLGVEIVKQATGADPAAVAFDAADAAVARGADVCIVDTAGRLHTQSNLMEELKKVRRVIGRLDDTAPHETLLVIDATNGQNALSQARQFHDAVGVTGIALTKLDGTARGGVLFGIAGELGIPIRYIGVGEQAEDLRPFDAGTFVNAVLPID